MNEQGVGQWDKSRGKCYIRGTIGVDALEMNALGVGKSEWMWIL